MFRKVAVISVAMAVLAAMPGGILARSDRAILINVHVTHAKPGPATANCSPDPGGDNGQYALTGWKVSGNKTAHLNANTVPSGIAGGALTQLRNSFSAWSAVSGVPTIGVDSNGTVSKATANHSYDLMWGRTGGSSIAVTYTWQWGTGEIESDTVFNNRLPWFIATDEPDHCVSGIAKYDVANIGTHEFGHTYGLDHASSDRWETMYPYGFTGETAKRSLGSGDTAGVFDVYH
jgi:hypothetical protein